MEGPQRWSISRRCGPDRFSPNRPSVYNLLRIMSCMSRTEGWSWHLPCPPSARIRRQPLMRGRKRSRLMRILIAEDDPISRRLLERTLQQWGYEVTTARDGVEAWRLFEERDYPLVISDWIMPGMDGLELV